LESHAGALVIAFVSDAHWPALTPLQRRVLRAELRALGAVLAVAATAGLWWFDPEREWERFEEHARDTRDAAPLARLPWARALVGDGGALLEVIFLLGEGARDRGRRLRFVHRLRPTPHRAGAQIFEDLTTAFRAARRRPVGDEASLPAEPPPFRPSRRDVLAGSLAAALTTVFVPRLATGASDGAAASPRDAPAPPQPQEATKPASLVRLKVNGARHDLALDPRVSLLDALREHLHLTGTKKGCDQGQCGACTVLVGGRRVLSCLTLAVTAQGTPITTVEGLARGPKLHPLQSAFIKHDGLQCGYCTPGQIMSAMGLLKEGRAHTDEEVREQMAGNICRCGAYPGIVAAIQAARKEV
jgi:xanthine dehydrogenase YagT iron-sulfur-binding subunit